MNDYRNGINTPDLIRSLMTAMAPSLKMGTINLYAFLGAIAQEESAFGKYDLMKYEPAYGPAGVDFEKSKELKIDYLIYGAAVSCSYSPWQILYATAKSLGYMGEPLDLWKAAIALPFVIKCIQQDYTAGANTVAKLAQAYNSGSFKYKPNAKVQAYVDRVSGFYDRILLSKS